MRTIHKFLVSLLISIIVLGAFIVLGYTGLFETIETVFYNQRILENKTTRVDAVYEAFTQYFDDNIQRFSSILENEAFQSVFDLNQTKDNIDERNRIIGEMQDALIGFQYLRIVNFRENSQQIEFSSNANDVRSSSGNRIVYKLWRNSNDFIEGYVQESIEPTLNFDESTDSVVFRIPVYDINSLKKGLALIYFSSSGFKDYLFSKGLTSSGEQVQLLGTSSVIIDMKKEQKEEVRQRLTELIDDNSEQPQLLSEDLEDERYLIRIRNISSYAAVPDLSISIVIKESELELNPLLIIVLLTLLFTTVFLVVFLIFNLRQDRTVVIASRIKKFQLNFLVDYLENKNELDWAVWEREMSSRRDQVRKEFKKGLGRFKKGEEDQIDKLINSSWDEIISVISRNKEVKSESQDFDLKKIEQIIQKALSNVNITVPAERVAVPKARKKPAPVPVEVEEISEADEIEELDDLEDLGEPIEVEDLSEADEIEELDDLEDLGEPIEVEDLSEADEIEELDDLEDLGEPIEVEDLSEADEIDTIPEAIEVLEEELEELSVVAEMEQLPMLEEEELESIPVLAGAGEASLMELASDYLIKGSVDFSGQGYQWGKDDYYSSGADLEEVDSESIEKTGDLDMVDELVDVDDIETLDEHIEHFEELEELDELDEIEDFDDVEELDELDELDELEELDEIEEVQEESVIYFEEIDFESFITVKTDGTVQIPAVPESISAPVEEELVSSDQDSDDLDFVHIYSDDLLPQFIDDEKVEKIGEESSYHKGLVAALNGFDFDGYASSRKDDYKALISITRDINAVGGIIYSGSAGEYNVELSLGIGADLVQRLSYLLDKEGIKEIIANRNIVHIFNTSHNDLQALILDQDRRFLKAILFIPIVFNERQAYLFLGFKKPLKNIESLLKSIS